MARRPPEKHLNLNVRGMNASATVAINEHSNALIAEGRTVYKLGLGQSPFPVPRSVVEALREHAHEKAYLPVRGLYELRRAVAHYTERKAGIDRTADDVLIGPGSKELMFLLQLVFYGDLVIPTPAWVSYAPQARIIGRRVRLIPTRRDDGWMITPDALEALCREDPDAPRIVILNYPSNPTGSTFKTEQLRSLAKVARQHRVLLLSDEIYGELHHKGEHVSLARYYPEGTIISAGLSKWCGAGGWRLGTFVFPESLRWLLDAMSAVASETFTSTSAPIQYAAVTAFEGGEDIERYLSNSRRVLSALGRWCARKLRAVDIDCPQPVGGFYLFPDFTAFHDALRGRGIETSPQLCARLLDETGVAILPGSEFGRPEQELTARLAYVDFDGDKALEAVAVIPKEQPLDETFLKRHCGRVVSAIEALCDWAERVARE
ncbi:MAG TPA: aminotransferase class I/II-fold pyridoxal phosphate-dependent enzyme [Sandaracinaceae bacterium LLY-WYZ-13_1]|nr:aminotransferase class I/II-fold pyridoxal phosphate-dependent enzyme [Sandaracinaceae bacterium LLY-WYZ-13_1]